MNDGRMGGGRAAEVSPAADETEPSRAGSAAHRQAGGDVPLSDISRTRIGTHLRAMYDQMVQQPVPDRFRDLIARLEAGDAARSGGAEPEAEA